MKVEISDTIWVSEATIMHLINQVAIALYLFSFNFILFGTAGESITINYVQLSLVYQLEKILFCYNFKLCMVFIFFVILFQL